MNLNQETTTKNIWYRKGKEPLVEAKRKGESQSFYGALNLRTGKETAIAVDRQDSKHTIRFLKKLAKQYYKRRILLVWDNAGWHKSKEVRQFLKTTRQFTLMNFPPYTPEFNPQEHVWKNLRQNVTHNCFEEDFAVTVKTCLKYLNKHNFKSIKFPNLFGRD
jgi:transposase